MMKTKITPSQIRNSWTSWSWNKIKMFMKKKMVLKVLLEIIIVVVKAYLTKRNKNRIANYVKMIAIKLNLKK